MVWNALNTFHGQMIVAFNPLDDQINRNVPLQSMVAFVINAFPNTLAKWQETKPRF